METSATSKSAGVLYRYRTGDKLSAWMRSDELRAHAADGRIKPESSIQQVGKEQWVPAAKVPGLWVGTNPGGSTVMGASMSDQNGHDATNDGVDHAGAAAAAHAAGGSASAGGAASSGLGTPHPSRLGESIQHLLQRAVLAHVTVSAPEFETPQRAILAGVTGDAVALEFEACGTVVYIPWTRVRSVAVPSKEAHSSGRIRANAELLVIDVERIPTSVTQATQQA